MLDDSPKRLDEKTALEGAGAKVWARDANWRQALEDYVSRPTVTIEGLVGGYTGPGGKTILPTKMTAKIDIRLVPDMTLRGHVRRRCGRTSTSAASRTSKSCAMAASTEVTSTPPIHA